MIIFKILEKTCGPKLHWLFTDNLLHSGGLSWNGGRVLQSKIIANSSLKKNIFFSRLIINWIKNPPNCIYMLLTAESASAAASFQSFRHLSTAEARTHKEISLLNSSLQLCKKENFIIYASLLSADARITGNVPFVLSLKV